VLQGLLQAVVWVTSGILIAVGAGLIWRDASRRRRLAAGRLVRQDQLVPSTTAADEPLADVKIEAAPAAKPGVFAALAQRKVRPSEGLAELDRTITKITDEIADDADEPDMPRDPALPKTWSNVQSNLALAVDRTNPSLDRVGVQIAAAGEPGWSFRNRGYGVYRRIYMSGESLAWLRIDVGHNSRVTCRVRTHKTELAMLNHTAEAGVTRLSETAATDLVVEALKPLAEYAAWIVPRQRMEQQQGKDSWEEISSLVDDALLAARGALAPAGATLTAAGPGAWDAEIGRYRLVAHVATGLRGIARMHVERIGDEIEIAVGVPDARLLDLGRRRRLAIAGLTTLTLAEAMAICAWPSIAEAQAQRASA
jgi:hypothetical protein